MSKVMDLTIYTNEDGLLAYIDLLGTKDLYRNRKVPLKNTAEVLYRSLLDKFSEDFQNRFTTAEIRDHFYVNIYSDSIMICHRGKKTKNVVNRMTEVLLRFQTNLLFTLGIDIRIDNRDYRIPVTSRILIGNGKYFTLALKAYRNRSILGSKYSSISLCGGYGMLEADNKLKGLPIGVYIHRDLIKQAEIHRSRKIKASGNLYFIKQDPKYIDFFLRFGNHESLRALVDQVIESSPVRSKKEKGKWEQWVSAHEGKLLFIKKDNATLLPK